MRQGIEDGMKNVNYKRNGIVIPGYDATIAIRPQIIKIKHKLLVQKKIDASNNKLG